MTREAIDSWKLRAESRFDKNAVNEIAQILIEASARAELLADNSKDVFEPEHRPQPSSLDELRALLDRSLSSSRPTFSLS
jgi:hypothetical protein